jgi:hypothetical protein
MSFNIQGVIHNISPTEVKTESFSVRDFILKTDSRGYENFIKFQLTQDRCDIIDSFAVGQEVNVFFDLKGRKHGDRYFTNINAWKIEGPVNH